MFGLRKSLSTLLLLVAFFVLISLATTIYNSDTGEKRDLTPSELAQTSGVSAVNAIQTGAGMAAKEVNTNNGFGEKVVGLFKAIDWKTLVQKLSTSSRATKAETVKEIPEVGQGQVVENPEDKASSTFLTKLTTLVKDELKSSGSQNINSLEDITVDNIQTNIQAKGADKFIELVKNNSGAELILKAGENNELKIPLPFKFLSNSN